MSVFVDILLKIFKDPYERKIKKVMPTVEHINTLEADFVKMSDDELKAKTAEFRAILASRPTSSDPKKDKALEKEVLDRILPEAFATVREAGRRVLNMRHFDVQLIGGIFLHEGQIAEMRTGEGKTLVATLSAYLNALAGKGVHIVTVNDYLAQRDRDWMGKIYEFLGLSVGVVLSSSRSGAGSEDEFVQKKHAYNCDITYGTNNEFGFDYLRDNMASSTEHCVQRPFNYAIIDEVDSILIDEARTPLIISGRLEKSAETYHIMAKIAPVLEKVREEEVDGEKVKIGDYEVDEKNKNVILSEDGIDKAQELLGVEELFDIQTQYAHHLLQALKAKELFVKDTDYVIKEGEVVIVDEFTGRLMEGRRWSDGLHQAVEAKEGVPIQDETQTLASITFQNLFRLYPKLSGMTGTAMTEEAEFGKIYNLPCMPIPTNRSDIRQNHPDVIYKTRESKYKKAADEIETVAKTGRPILVGTISIEKSELLSNYLKKKGVKHHVLNAKHHEKEAYIIAQAGRVGAVTIATNMAGRGTDILLGGNSEYLAKEDLEKRGITEDTPNYPELKNEALSRAREITEREHAEVIKLGGLYVIGTERHESRRIDNQLRGRAARQGDPGSTRFFLSLEDDLMRIFGGEKITQVMNMLKVEEDMAIESGLISRQIESAQKKVETYHFDIRKNVLEYDDVINIQRDKFYEQRRKVLREKDLRTDIQYMMTREVDKILSQYITPEMSPYEYNLEELKTMMSEIHSVFVQLKDLKLEDLKDLRYAQMSEKLKNLVREAYKKHEEQTVSEFNSMLEKFSPGSLPQGSHSDNNILRHVEKDILLQVIDYKWIDHLNNIDALKDSIGLVAYGQKDPLIEYKKGAFEYFNAMMSEIQSETIRHLMRAKFGVQVMEEAPLLPDEEQEYETELTRALKHSNAVPVDDTDSHEFEKVGRNEPCPCGSGKKYKKCCAMHEKLTNK
ncbi:preprotein translocase subunit SecA [Candidatus Gastranaerophilus sp. (ex Termes propinquus)]|nr:preprotein translocase subunit SecA [Candidatus Gastranaerophilus sp. (ex Termes propinquus)]